MSGGVSPTVRVRAGRVAQTLKTRAFGWCCAPSLSAVLLMAACAGPSHVYCTTCDVAYEECLIEDDFEACRLMRRYCLGWCTGAQSCDEACDGVSWACEASPLVRSTCAKSIDACRAHCYADEELDFDFPETDDAPPAEGERQTGDQRQ